ncbi:hypothetical protein PENPOL_c012G03646 [Penicillium polonicum]|nr:hypothetical protein PENPOL_c012G03646 [Penicillium polonicum]
MDHPEDY